MATKKGTLKTKDGDSLYPKTSWDNIDGKPDIVKSVNNVSPDASGNVTLSTFTTEASEASYGSLDENGESHYYGSTSYFHLAEDMILAMYKSYSQIVLIPTSSQNYINLCRYTTSTDVCCNAYPIINGHIYDVLMYYTGSSTTKFRIRFRLLTTSYNVSTYAYLRASLYYSGHTSSATALMCSGVVASSSYVAQGIYATSSSIVIIYVNGSSFSEATLTVNSSYCNISNHQLKQF